MEETPNISKEREDFLVNLQRQVDLAYKNRALETEDPNTDTTEELLKDVLQFRKEFENLPDDAILVRGEIELAKCEVAVYNPHDYRDLLRMAVKKFWQDEEFINSDVESRLKHEKDHYIPLLGQDGLKLAYKVHFYQDRKTGKTSFYPLVTFGGKVKVGILKDAIITPSPSSGDNVLVGK